MINDVQNREKKFALYFLWCCKQLHNKCAHECCLKLIIGNDYLRILWWKKEKTKLHITIIHILKLNYDKDENRRYKRYKFIMLVFFTFINYVYLSYVCI